MTLIALPRGINGIEWTPPPLAEYVSRSSYSGKATVIDRGGTTGGFRAKVTVAARSNADMRAWKAFAMATASKANVFRLPAASGGLQASMPVSVGVYGTGSLVNQLLYNNDLTNGAWTTTGLTSIAANTDVTPINSVGDAFTALEDTSTGAHGIQQSFAGYDTGKQYCFSVWARSRNRSKIGLVAGSDGLAVFDLSAGTVTANTGVAAGIIADDFGWYRCWLAFTSSAGTAQAFIRISDTGDVSLSYTGNNAFGISLWRPQLEYGMRPSPVIVNAGTRISSLRACVLTGLGASSVVAPAGSMISFYDRLHVLAGDLVTGAAGITNLSVSPPLARPTTSSDTMFLRAPFGRMRMITPAGWADALGYGSPAQFECEEAL